MTKISNAISVEKLTNKKFIDIPLGGEFKELLGDPERSGSWFVFGESGHGKTTFILSLCKELSSVPKIKIAYNTLEEGARKSFQNAVVQNQMEHCRKGSFVILDKEPIELLRTRLSKHKAPNVIVIDSCQYANLDKLSYKKLLKDFPRTLFVFNSHAVGKRPVGAIGRDIKFDADIAIRVHGYCAFAEKSRMNRGKLARPYIIWEEGAREFWGDIQIDLWKK